MRGVRLMKNRFSIWQHQGVCVIKATHPGHRSKVMIKRPIFLHKNDDMLDVVESASLCRFGQRFAEIWRQER